MSKHNDVLSIGSVYGDMLNTMKRKLVSEGKVGPKVKAGEIGESPLIKGGPQSTSGYMPSVIDKKTLSKKSTENAYNIDNLSEDEESPKGTFTKVFKSAKKQGKSKEAASKIAGSVKSKLKEEDEETVIKTKKIAQESLNNFMKKKSIFDKLYENVMSGGGPLGGSSAPAMGGGMEDEMGEGDELDALGIEGEDEFGGEGEDVTFTLDRETAQKLIDVLQAAIGGEEGDMEDMEDMGEDFGAEDEGEDDGMDEDEQGFWDEDEEDLGHSGVNAKEPNMGKNNKVGNLKVQSGGASSKYTDKVGNDGDYGHAGVNAKEPNMGKNNKVGSLKTGKSLFEQ